MWSLGPNLLTSYLNMYISLYTYIIEDAGRDLRIHRRCAIFEQGRNQGIGRNHQDPIGNARCTRLGGSQRASWGLLGGPQGPLKYRGGVTSRGPLARLKLFDPSAPVGPCCGDLRFVLADPWGSLGCTRPSLGRTGGHGGPLGDVRKLPARVQSNFNINEKLLFLITFQSIEVI